ncbi:hypothetical protein BH24BAC1_BH24BAC1_15350 [soil metagenome]|jgi:hypothetical protein
MEEQLKLLYKFIKRMADLVGVVLLLAAILFASRGL